MDKSTALAPPRRYPLKIRLESAFLDVMIFRDVIGLRERQSDGYPLWASSTKLLLAICQNAIPSVYTSPLSLMGIAAEAKIAFRDKQTAEKNTMEFIDNFVTRNFNFVELTHDIIEKALSTSVSELEDRIIYFSALKAGVECLVTRNTKDLRLLCKINPIKIMNVEAITGYPR